VAITLIVGLGNPGPHYATTRHNAGFWVIDQIASRYRGSLRQESKFFGEVGRIEILQANVRTSVWLQKPMTFMNRSGQAVAALANYYKIPAEEILVVHDELDFPPGTIRLKQGGGDGKHNGLKDIIAHLGTPQFLRLRIGIGHPGKGGDVTAHVLNPPMLEEKITIEAVLSGALEVIPLLVAGEVEKATHKLHSQKRE
jgi:peptidyl-tRNA hydrolase, PTH1 family